jgi:hypothetical protein
VVAADPFGRFDNEFGAIAFQAGPAWRCQAGVVDLAGCNVVEDEGSFGSAAAGADSATRKGGEEAIIVCLAGAAAERRFDPDASPSLARSDREMAEDLALALNGGDKDLAAGHLGYLELRADSLVASRWRMIEALASMLMSRGVLGSRSAAIESARS